MLATRIGRSLSLGAEGFAEIYYQSLLRYIGCNAETHTMAALFGDEIDFRRDFARIDMGRANEMARWCSLCAALMRVAPACWGWWRA